MEKSVCARLLSRWKGTSLAGAEEPPLGVRSDGVDCRTEDLGAQIEEFATEPL